MKIPIEMICPDPNDPGWTRTTTERDSRTSETVISYTIQTQIGTVAIEKISRMDGCATDGWEEIFFFALRLDGIRLVEIREPISRRLFWGFLKSDLQKLAEALETRHNVCAIQAAA